MRKIFLFLLPAFLLLVGVEAWGDTKEGSWDLTSTSGDWTQTNCTTYFSQPYGMKKVNAQILNKNISDFSTSGITKIKIGVKSLQNGGTGSVLTIYLVDKDGTIVGSGKTITPVNDNAASKTTFKYVEFTTGFTGVTGYKIQCTTFDKNVLVNGTSYEITYTADPRTAVSVNSLTFSASYVAVSGSTVTATASHNTPACTTASFTYESLDTDKATCTSAGVITAVASGTARIKATMSIPNDDPDYRVGTATITETITVKKAFHTATFSINGEEIEDSFEEESAISFPDAPSALGGKAFIGWKKDSGIDGSIDSPVPSTVTSTSMGTSDVSYFAVYATEEIGDLEFEKYQKVTSAQTDWSGTYLLGATSSGNTYVYSTPFESVDKGNYGISVQITPGTTEYPAYEVVIEKLNDGNYSIYHKNSSKYFGWTSGNAINFAASVAGNSQKWTITGNSGVICNVSDAGRKLQYNGTSPRFACYTSSQTATNLYKRIETQDISYSAYCTSIDLVFTEQTEKSLSANDASGYWATFSDASNVTFFPKNHNTDKVTTIYTVDVEESTLSLHALSATDATIDASTVNGYFVPANTGVLIKCSGNSVPYYTVENKYVAPLSNNMLLPGKGETTTADVASLFYLLGIDGGKVGFYWGAASGAAFTARNGGAYLAVPTGSGAPARYWITDEENNATSIDSIEAANETVKFIQDGKLFIKKNGVVYDALGRIVR